MAHDPKQRLAEAELDELFAEARLHAPLPAADLMRRIEADALRLQPPPLVAPVVERPATAPRRLGAWITGQLGRFALPSGVLAAGLTGIWIGFSLGADAVSTNYSFYDSDLGMRIVYEFPVLAGILPEG